jgi:hypothetical protein
MHPTRHIVNVPHQHTARAAPLKPIVVRTVKLHPLVTDPDIRAKRIAVRKHPHGISSTAAEPAGRENFNAPAAPICVISLPTTF